MTLPPSLAEVAADPALIDQLPGGPPVAALAAQAAAIAYRLAMRAACAPMLVAESAGPQRTGGTKDAALVIGLKPATLYKLAKRDPAYRALTVDTGTDRMVFDLEACRRFVDLRRRGDGSAVVRALPRRVPGRVGRPSGRQPGSPSPGPA